MIVRIKAGLGRINVVHGPYKRAFAPGEDHEISEAERPLLEAAGGFEFFAAPIDTATPGPPEDADPRVAGADPDAGAESAPERPDTDLDDLAITDLLAHDAARRAGEETDPATLERWRSDEWGDARRVTVLRAIDARLAELAGAGEEG